MTTLPVLVSRINTLFASQRQTVSLIERLQEQPDPSSANELYDYDAREELASDIQQSLKEQEDELEFIRLDVEDIGPPTTNGSAGARWVGGNSLRGYRDSERDSERERIVSQVTKLSENLRSYGNSPIVKTVANGYRTRRHFRRARLSAKRFADEAKTRQREELFAPILSEDTEPVASSDLINQPQHSRIRNNQTEKKHLTHEDVTLAASSDMTNALRRTHNLLQSSIEQSLFAAETLESSSAALATLSESYSSLDAILASSRSLASSLIKSNKSDTWYLTTAFYVCVSTLAWLVFRRWFYGPLWWFLWLPLKWTWWSVAGLIGSITSQSSSAPSSGLSAQNMPMKVLPTTSTSTRGKAAFPKNNPQAGGWKDVPVRAKGAGWGGPAMPPPRPTTSITTMVDKIGEMAERIRDQVNQNDGVPEDEESGKGTNIDDISDEERARQEAQPRNPKKRMWEEDVRSRDEL